MHILFITANKQFLVEGSEQRELLSMMSNVTESLHVVVLNTRGDGYEKQKIGEHTWLYPTNSLFSFLLYFDGLSTIRHQVMWQDELHADVILSDDPKIAGWLGIRIAGLYGRVWMVNLHDYFWDLETSVPLLFSRYTVVPLKDIFTNAFRIIAFSERVAIYTQSKGVTDEEKAKVVVFPEIYTAPSAAASVDIKVKHPEFNFIVLHYLGRHSDKISLAIEAMEILHHSYQHSGMVLMITRKPTSAMLAEVVRMNATNWIRFEVIEPESFPFTNANVFLYLNGGEDEDVMFIRAASTATLPIVAAQSIVSEKILSNNINGLIVYDLNGQTIASTIRKLNEIPGMRESFRVNADLLLQQQILPSRTALVEKLREYFNFEYNQKPGDASEPEKHLFSNLTDAQSILGKIKARLNRIKVKYTKL